MMRGWLEFEGLPAPGLLLGAAILTEIVGGALLVAGVRARWVAVALIGYLVPVHLLLHDFWVLEGAERQSQHEQFFKGLMIIGGLLFLYAYGPGAASFDEEPDE